MARTELASGTAVEIVHPADPAAGACGVVIIPDIFGLRPLFDDMAARLSAEHGWHVAAIEPFPGRDLGTDVDGRFAAMATMDDHGLLGDVVLAAEMLGTSRVGCIGFCMGGMYALKAASTGALDRIAAFYGMIRVPPAWQGPGQAEPLECLHRRSSRTEVMAIIGSEDPYTPPDDVAQLAEVDGVVVVEYPEAGHGFVHDASRPAHRADYAADAWARVAAFFDA